MRFKSPLLWVALSSLLTLPAQAKTVYEWVDPQGNRHFSDAKPLDVPSTEIQLPDAQGYAPQQIDAFKRRERPEAQAPVHYTVSFVYPTAGEYLLYSVEQLEIQVAVEPSLEEAHFIELSIDGNTLPLSKHTLFTVPALERGEHTLSARVINEHGKIFSRPPSATITVYQQRFFKRS